METGFWSGYAWPAVILIIKIVAVIVPIILSMAYLTYFERKVIAAVQRFRDESKEPGITIRLAAGNAGVLAAETAAHVVGVLIPVFSSYLMHKRWTFASKVPAAVSDHPRDS